MMKKFIFFMVIIGIIGTTNLASAQETPQVTVGLKIWYATWTETIPNFSGGTASEESTDPSLLAGPTIGVRYGKFFGGLTYLFGTFDWADEPICVTSGCTSSDPDFTWQWESDRTDLDLVVGYNFHPRWGVLLGYKQSKYTTTITCVDEFFLCLPFYGTTQVEFDTTASGPVIGVNYNFPIGESRWIIFGNLSFLLLTLDQEGFEEEDAPGYSFELAAAYAFESAPVSLTAGYKIQSFEGEDSEIVDKFSGLTLGANYTF